MAVAFKKVQPGMALFHRALVSVPGVRGLKMLEEHRFQVLGVYPDLRMVRCAGPRGFIQVPASLLHRYFVWSMHDAEVAEVVRGPSGLVVRARKKKTPSAA